MPALLPWYPNIYIDYTQKHIDPHVIKAAIYCLTQKLFDVRPTLSAGC